MSFPASFRRSAILLSVAVWATVLPVLGGPARGPRVEHRAIPLEALGVVRAPAPFGLVGVTWPAGADAPSEVRVRTSLDGKRWSRWTELDADEVDLGPDRGTEGTGVRSTTPLWVGEKRFADVRVEGRLPRGARVHVIDPGPDPKGPAASAQASPGKPGIITRAQWGADESIRKCCPRYAKSLKLAIVHHTATGNSYSAQQSAGIVRSIYAYHVQGNGWDDIGYNFLVDRHGQIYEGRAGGVDKAVIGAQAQGFNTGSTGVAVIGTFTSAPPPGPAIDGLTRLLAWRLDQAYIDPLGSRMMTSGGSSKWPAGQQVPLNNIAGHVDVGQTTCPGQPFFDAFPSLRNAVAGYGDPKLYDGPKRSTSIITPNADGYLDGVWVSARFSSDVNWKIDVSDPGGKVWQKWSGSGSSASVLWWGKTSSGKQAPHDKYRFRITGSNSRGALRTAYLSVWVYRFPNGTLFKTKTSGWSAILLKGKLRHPSSSRALKSRYRSSEYVLVTESLRKLYPLGKDIGFREGSVVRADGKLFVISDGKRRPVTQSTLDFLGYDRRSTIETTLAALAPHPVGTTLATTEGYPNGAALRSTTGEKR